MRGLKTGAVGPGRRARDKPDGEETALGPEALCPPAAPRRALRAAVPGCRYGLEWETNQGPAVLLRTSAPGRQPPRPPLLERPARRRGKKEIKKGRPAGLPAVFLWFSGRFSGPASWRGGSTERYRVALNAGISAAQVSRPTLPSTFRPLLAWKEPTSRAVFWPYLPSTVRMGRPWMALR